MDSGVHVWSTPLGYCDDDTEGHIKDEELVSVDPDGSFPDPCDPIADNWDPHNLPSDPLSISATDTPATFEDLLMTSDGCDTQLTAGPSTVCSVPDKSSAEETVLLVDQDDLSDCLWFKAEPVDESALTAAPAPAPAPGSADPPTWVAASDRENRDYPPSPESPLTTNLIDPESGRELFVCKLCRSTYKHKTQLEGHYRATHPGYRPYKCDICGNRYRKASFALSHRKLHTGQRDFVCDACGKSFITQARLTVHLKTSRLCPASKNVDRKALQKRLDSKTIPTPLEKEQVSVIRQRLLENAARAVASSGGVVIEVPDSP